MKTTTLEAELLLTARDATGRGLRSATNNVRTAASEMGRYAGMIGRFAGGFIAFETGRRAVAAVGTAAIETDRQLNALRITSGATSAEIETMRRTLVLGAGGLQTSTRALSESVSVLVQSGLSLDTATRSVGSVAKAATASGAAMADMNDTAVVLLQNLGASPQTLERFFDIAIKGGKAGRFELANMASEIPSISSAAQQVGLVGEEGFARLVAMLQISRQFSASGEEAANNLRNLFDKMIAPGTIKALSKFGVDWNREMKEARRNGRDLTETFVELVGRVTEADPTKIAEILPDREARTALLALVQSTGKYKEIVDALNDSLGETERDHRKATEGAAAGIDHLAAAWSNWLDVVANGTKSALASATGDVADFFDDAAANLTMREAFASIYKSVSGDAVMLPNREQEDEIGRIIEAVQAGRMTAEDGQQAIVDQATVDGAGRARKAGRIDDEQYRMLTTPAVHRKVARNQAEADREYRETREGQKSGLRSFADAMTVAEATKAFDLFSPVPPPSIPQPEPSVLSGGATPLPAGRFVTREEFEQIFSPMPGLPGTPMQADPNVPAWTPQERPGGDTRPSQAEGPPLPPERPVVRAAAEEGPRPVPLPASRPGSARREVAPAAVSLPQPRPIPPPRETAAAEVERTTIRDIAEAVAVRAARTVTSGQPPTALSKPDGASPAVAEPSKPPPSRFTEPRPSVVELAIRPIEVPAPVPRERIPQPVGVATVEGRVGAGASVAAAGLDLGGVEDELAHLAGIFAEATTAIAEATRSIGAFDRKTEPYDPRLQPPNRMRETADGKLWLPRMKTTPLGADAGPPGPLPAIVVSPPAAPRRSRDELAQDVPSALPEPAIVVPPALPAPRRSRDELARDVPSALPAPTIVVPPVPTAPQRSRDELVLSLPAMKTPPGADTGPPGPPPTIVVPLPPAAPRRSRDELARDVPAALPAARPRSRDELVLSLPPPKPASVVVVPPAPARPLRSRDERPQDDARTKPPPIVVPSAPAPAPPIVLPSAPAAPLLVPPAPAAPRSRDELAWSVPPRWTTGRTETGAGLDVAGVQDELDRMAGVFGEATTAITEATRSIGAFDRTTEAYDPRLQPPNRMRETTAGVLTLPRMKTTPLGADAGEAERTLRLLPGLDEATAAGRAFGDLVDASGRGLLEALRSPGTIEAVVTKPVKAELQGRASVDVRVRVDGPARVVAATSSSSGHIQTNVGTTMPHINRRPDRRDE